MKVSPKRIKSTIFSLTFASAIASISIPSSLNPSITLAKMNEAPTTRHIKELPLGKSGLPEKRVIKQLTEGVTFISIERGKKSNNEYYTVDIGFFNKKTDAAMMIEDLKNKGYDTYLHTIKNDSTNDVKHHKLGYLVRVGKFPAEKEANNLNKKLKSDGFLNAKVTYTGFDSPRTTGPWSIHVIEIDRHRFKGTISTSLAMDKVEGKETVSSMAKRTQSIAATNGGYFVMDAKDGTPGDLAGISVHKGQLVSEAVNSRTSFILPNAKNNASISKVSTHLSIQSSDGAKRELDGMNRQPGFIRSCGGVGGDLPTQLPMHDFTCKDDSELIEFDPIFGRSTPEGKGVEAVLNAEGNVVEVREQRGGPIPFNGSVIAGTNEAALWLKKHAKRGMRLTTKHYLYVDGKPYAAGKGTNIVNGGPRLLKNGKIFVNAEQEGFHANEEFFYHFGITRHPRTMAGIKANGNILLVTVDGRNPERSVGTSFKESAKIMKALGAKEALNLDGGGSTAMAVGGKLISHPSDAAGERPVGDSITILPK
ncbi:phosphodiester glycosidase family protein [Fictibacillus gelatini]|uniref:phosphodiester glycosidase family protein n=1 Tax=Fictibacillus gelatini TaxID=225985 RepID=UPI00041C44A2|nr:phosphodiester glycosidase family protein [Fictibacillus gelatini]